MSFFSFVSSIIPASPGEVRDLFDIVPLRSGIIAGTTVSLVYALNSSFPSIHGYRSDIDYFYHSPYFNSDISVYGVYSGLVSLIGMYGSYNKSPNALKLFEIFTYLDLARCMINSISEGGEIDFRAWVNISFFIAAVSLVAISCSVYKAPVKVVTLYLTKLYQKNLLSGPAIVGLEKRE